VASKKLNLTRAIILFGVLAVCLIIINIVLSAGPTKGVLSICPLSDKTTVKCLVTNQTDYHLDFAGTVSGDTAKIETWFSNNLGKEISLDGKSGKNKEGKTLTVDIKDLK